MFCCIGVAVSFLIICIIAVFCELYCKKINDESEESFKNYILKFDFSRDIKFYGKMLGKYKRTTCISEDIIYERYELYITKDNVYVCLKEELGYSHIAKVNDLESVVKFFGFNEGTKELYKQANIPDDVLYTIL